MNADQLEFAPGYAVERRSRRGLVAAAPVPMNSHAFEPLGPPPSTED